MTKAIAMAKAVANAIAKATIVAAGLAIYFMVYICQGQPCVLYEVRTLLWSSILLSFHSVSLLL